MISSLNWKIISSLVLIFIWETVCITVNIIDFITHYTMPCICFRLLDDITLNITVYILTVIISLYIISYLC